MAEPIRTYTPQRDAREELRRKVESAPADHGEALLAAYELLQEAQDHGVLDTLRGAIGAGETFIGKVSEYANTPEGIRLMRNLLAMARLFGDLDPAVLDAAAKVVAHMSRREDGKGADPPSPGQALRQLASRDSRRTLAMLAGISEAFGRELNAIESHAGSEPDKRCSRPAILVPMIAVAIATTVAGFWIARRS